MRVAVTVGVVSVVAAALMIRSAIAVGFGVFVAPIVLAELLFLGAVYLIWRGLGGDEHASETPETPRAGAGRRPAHPVKPPRAARPAAGHGLGGRSLVGRTGAGRHRKAGWHRTPSF